MDALGCRGPSGQSGDGGALPSGPCARMRRGCGRPRPRPPRALGPAPWKRPIRSRHVSPGAAPGCGCPAGEARTGAAAAGGTAMGDAAPRFASVRSLPLLLLLLLRAERPQGTELTFELPHSAKQCFHEDVERGVRFSLEYQVGSGSPPPGVAWQPPAGCRGWGCPGPVRHPRELARMTPAGPRAPGSAASG